MRPKYPQIIVRLSGQDGNAFMILALCRQAAKESGLSREEIDTFFQEATGGDYNHLLQVVARWFVCE